MNETIKLRDWLNPVGAMDTGFVSLSVCHRFRNKDEEPLALKDCYFDASFEIADCTRRIWLTFDVYNSEEDGNYVDQYKARKEKIAILRKYLDTIENEMDKFYRELTRLKELECDTTKTQSEEN